VTEVLNMTDGDNGTYKVSGILRRRQFALTIMGIWAGRAEGVANRPVQRADRRVADASGA
jgi:hypothetical protein